MNCSRRRYKLTSPLTLTLTLPLPPPQPYLHLSLTSTSPLTLHQPYLPLTPNPTPGDIDELFTKTLQANSQQHDTDTCSSVSSLCASQTTSEATPPTNTRTNAVDVSPLVQLCCVRIT